MACLRSVEIEITVGRVSVPLIDLQVAEIPAELEGVFPPELRKIVGKVPGIVVLAGGADGPAEAKTDLAGQRDRRSIEDVSDGGPAGRVGMDRLRHPSRDSFN